ncbi:histidine phosphatase family protein [Brevibacillus sp. SIMBA_040]|uniref:histidine phosphatase family protein n=1 Tax=unclassified Brevibacillus TaxID=2684853 RepID=UPI00397E0844
MKLIWVRHGETEINRQSRYLGHSDVPLHEHGKTQALELASRLLNIIELPKALYTSDLLRCVQTAEPLSAGWQLTAMTVPALRELSFGKWELLTYDEIMQRDCEHASRWYEDPYRQCPPQGESLEQLGKRVDQWLNDLLQSAEHSEGDTIVIVTHGGVVRWIQAAWVHQDPSAYWKMDGLKHGEALLMSWDGQRLIHESL